ncbi:FAD:protein FMN transferase [Paraburkholderia piptadeniae]|uniref:FAD:protein FMN transferase n=1 Tax=Paraburkholderia piptadeniae TaxID=1701573 RepID=UPI00135AF488|nr:FAD:protein FMN transferase [Paraburkholderia piptadeniae]
MTDTAIPLRDAGIVRRAKPLLGTLVDIAVGAADSEFALTAIGASFAEIRDVHRLMSFHEPASDVSRINRAAAGEPVEVDPRTAEVLRLATELQNASDGAFDCTVAPVLVLHRLLPRMNSWNEARPQFHERHAELFSSRVRRIPAFTIDACSVVKQRECLVDLGGIAKGYAVDRAVDAVTSLAAASRYTIDSVLVNAGGDLRYHGRNAVPIRLRDPRNPAQLSGAVAISDGALASSSTSGLYGRTHEVSPLIDPVGRIPLPLGAGVTIAAPCCAIADALTKVALITGNATHPLFARYGASVVQFLAPPLLSSGHR